MEFMGYLGCQWHKLLACMLLSLLLLSSVILLKHLFSLSSQPPSFVAPCCHKISNKLDRKKILKASASLAKSGGGGGRHKGPLKTTFCYQMFFLFFFCFHRILQFYQGVPQLFIVNHILCCNVVSQSFEFQPQFEFFFFLLGATFLKRQVQLPYQHYSPSTRPNFMNEIFIDNFHHSSLSVTVFSARGVAGCRNRQKLSPTYLTISGACKIQTNHTTQKVLKGATISYTCATLEITISYQNDIPFTIISFYFMIVVQQHTVSGVVQVWCCDKGRHHHT